MLLCCSAPACPTDLKFGSRTGLSLCLPGKNSKLNKKLINEVMPLQSYKTRCVFKTFFTNPVTIMIYVTGTLYAQGPKAENIHSSKSQVVPPVLFSNDKYCESCTEQKID